MIYLYGASGHAKVIIEILELQQNIIAGLIDTNPNIKDLLGYPVHTSLGESLNNNETCIIISIGNNVIRKKIAKTLSVNFIKAIHVSTNISSRCIIAEGSVIMAGVSINSNVIIGKHTIINTNSSIDHDCIVNDFVHISPNAAIAGNVNIGEGSHIGIGACIIQGVKIGKWVTVGAGAVIINDVPDYAVVVGNPGNVIKYNKINN